LNSVDKKINDLLAQRQIPAKPWNQLEIQIFMNKIAAMDSNNYQDRAGIGEREGRIFSEMVAQRNFNLGHGIGRSGDLNALQPKAAGSSMVLKLTRTMTMHALKLSGLNLIKDLIVIPAATGVGLSLVLQALRVKNPLATKVVWSRID
jgi:O-phospho-L-seryl-tRNASec:L-selenocysteinyl-tRNA synthase